MTRRAFVLLVIFIVGTILALCYAIGDDAAQLVVRYTGIAVGGLAVGAVLFGVIALVVALAFEWWEQR